MEEAAFLDLLHTYFPFIYDVKYMMTTVEGMYGGLSALAGINPVNMPCHHALSTCPVNMPCQYALSICPVNIPVSTVNTHPQPTLATHPLTHPLSTTLSPTLSIHSHDTRNHRYITSGSNWPHASGRE